MGLKFWWTIPFIGLLSWMAMFACIARRNYETSLLNSVLKPRNEMVQVALGVCFLTIINGILWLVLGKGIIINIFQQALTLVFQMTVFQYALKVFDPLQRWLSRDLVKKTCNLIKLFLGVTTLLLAVLIRVKDVYDVQRLENNYNYIAIYFLVIDFVLAISVCYFMWVFFNLYIKVRRGINFNSAEDKDPEVFNLRKRWVIDDINLDDLSHANDPYCLNVLKLEKIMIERFFFFMFLVFSMNMYKLSWGSSQFECSSRVSCSPSITERNFQRAINSLSYWMPDLICMVVWLLLLMRPCGDVVALPEERMSDEDKGMNGSPGKIEKESIKELVKEKKKGKEKEVDDQHAQKGREDRDNRVGSFDSDSSPGIKLSLISAPSTLSSDLSDPSDHSASRTFSHDDKETNGVVNGAKVSASSSDSKLLSAPQVEVFREVAVSCEEMILFHRESGIPVATLFAGRDTFAVLSMSAGSPSRKKSNTVVIQSPIQRKASPQLAKSSELQVADQISGCTWVEVGRSDCRVNKANPSFRAAFVIPSTPLEAKLYKVELFNVEEDDDNTFHSDNVDLAMQDPVASVLLTHEELCAMTDTSEEYTQKREGGLTLYRGTTQQKDITMHKIPNNFSELYVGTGGKMFITARKVRPFSQQFGAFDTVNGLDLVTRVNRCSNSGSETKPLPRNDALVRSFITKTFGHGVVPFDVILREELVESAYSFDVPAAFLRSLIPERMMELEIVIDRLGWKDMIMDTTEPTSPLDTLQWSSEFIRAIGTNVEVMRRAVHNYETTTDTFKSSKDKKVKELEFVPVNLHVHIFEMSSQHEFIQNCGSASSSTRVCDNHNKDKDNQFVCDFITVGAFSAHSKKFKQGGLWHLMQQFEYRLQQIAPNSTLTPSSSEEDFLLPHHIWSIEVLQHLPLDPLLLHLAFLARERFDICVSQCLSSVAAGFLARIKLMSPAVVERVVTIGMLFQFESLLSTQGHELGMLSDFFCAIKFMDFVQVRVYEIDSSSDKQTAVRIYREHELYIIDLGFAPAAFQDLPELVKQGCGVAVVPVLFTVGVNELQTYAETMAGKKAFHLQDLINRESLGRMEAYYSLAMRYDAGELEEEKASIRGSVSERESERQEGGRKVKKRVSKSTDQNFVDNLSKPANEGSSLWLQDPASSNRTLSVIRERLDSASLSKDFDLSSVTWGEVDRGVGGFCLWNGSKKKASEKADKRNSQSGKVLIEKDVEIESVHIEDDDDDDELHKHLYMLGKEKMQKELLLKQKRSHTISTQENPLVKDIETGPDSLDEKHRSRGAKSNIIPASSSLWHLDTESEATYEQELEKELELFGDVKDVKGDRSSASSANSCHSVSDAIQGSRISLVAMDGFVPDKDLMGGGGKEARLERLLHRLHSHVHASQGSGGKPFQILTDAAKLTRALDGVRFTSCKSAKDRTGMSVTLEEVQLAQEIYGLSAYEAKTVLITMRQHGVRLANAKKNVGKACFSFNRFQRKFLPAVYQPPLNVMGKVAS